jgi:hypothetical protein
MRSIKLQELSKPTENRTSPHLHSPHIILIATASYASQSNDTVILEGSARIEKNPGKLKQLRKDYVNKYQYTPDWSNDKDQIVFRVEPRIAHAWKAPRMHRSLVKFIL